jgi:threonine dehydrogenase-like Zn-dependent dehydrogenase
MKKLKLFTVANNTVPEKHFAWPLYGAGVGELGKDGAPVERLIPVFSSGELLMRIDAVSLCYTDVKEIKQGPNHPRLTERDLKTNPIVPGHEVSMTVVGVGENLSDQYKIGDRYTIQPDVWVDGKSIPFCFGMDGGYRQYTKIGKEILEGDAGNYLIPVPDDMSYAAGAITEPWACVEAAYRMSYRTALLEGGITWVIGSEHTRTGYQISRLFDQSKPKEVILTGLNSDLSESIKTECENKSIAVSEKEWGEIVGSELTFDDILLLDCPADVVTVASKKMNKKAVAAIYKSKQSNEMIEIDLGRLHYDDIYYVGSSSLDLLNAYSQTEPRATLKPNGIAWILGAGGPMGRMHLQRAIEAKSGLRLIIASEVTDDRFVSLKEFFYPLAKKHQKELIIVNPKAEPEKYQELMGRVMQDGGVDDIEVMVAVPPVIEDAPQYLADRGVINLFAGLKRGVCADFDPWLISGPRQVRFIGHSGSALDDQEAVVDRAVSGELKPELSVAAVGGLNQIADGIRAMQNWTFPGKIVIFPHVLDYTLTALKDFKKKDDEVYAALGDGKTWTKEAEAIFLNKELG